jgi:two-component system, chemotaxis family, sensor kinase CheA
MKIDTQLKDAYFSEAKQYLTVMNTALLALEKNPKKTAPLRNLQDAIHTLKSMSATMRYDEIAALCHAMEDIFDVVKNEKLPLEDIVDLLFECFDVLEASIGSLEQGGEEFKTNNLIEKLKQFIVASKARQKKSAGSRTSSEITEENTEQEEQESPIRQDIVTSDSIQVKVERLDTLMKLAEELLIAKMRLDRLKDEQTENVELASAVDSLSRLVTDMQYHITQARMVPIGMIFDRFPRMVRDLAKQEKKQVNLVMKGSEIEFDRQVLAQMGEPLVHILRNAVDHGIETPEARKKRGKPGEATLTLNARRDKGLAIIEVSDDGQGLDVAAIKNVAMKKGLIPEDATEEEILSALFSGLSTSQKVTTVSGRGLGLGIAKKTIASMGGTVKVESKPGKSTKFIIELPLTLAIVNSLFVRVAKETYAIPVANVVRMLTVKKEEIKGQLGYDALLLDKEDLPLVQLNTLFHHPLLESPTQEVVVVRKGNEKFGLGVDSLMATQEIVIKPLDRLVRENKYFSGSTIIGSGDAVLVLDVPNLAVLKKRGSHADQQRIGD